MRLYRGRGNRGRLYRGSETLAGSRCQESITHLASNITAVSRRSIARRLTDTRHRTDQSAFTLIELVVVVAILGLIMGLVGFRSGTFAYWKEEGFIRRLSETIVFLHHQAVSDRAVYRIEFNLKDNNYKVGVMRPDPGVESSIQDLAAEAGSLTLELAAMLNPSLGSGESMIPPPSFPSLAEEVALPAGCRFEDIRTMRGKTEAAAAESAYLQFSPRGFSEFGVIHMRTSSNAPVTILVNPFTGNTQIYREYKDFKWTYGRKKGKEDE